MRLLAILAVVGCMTTAACATTSDDTASEPGRPSIAETKTVDFLGRTFELKFQNADGPVRIYEYFLAQEEPDDWFELVEFQVYPVHPDANEPMDFARRTAAALKQKYPQMRFALYTQDDSDAALLDFFFPFSLRKEAGKRFLEFNAFKFFRDSASARVIGLHYAKNIEGPGASRSTDDVIADLKKARAEVVPGMASFPLFRQ